MRYGQLVLGPPGSGKTTYCHGIQQMCDALRRKHVVVNLDPANDLLPYECGIDIQELVKAESVMEEHSLGPNGALVFCMEYLLVNFDWLEDKLRKYPEAYVVFDCPGQVELYTHYDIMTKLIGLLQKTACRLTCVHLIDSTLCTDAHKYISALLVSLSGQIMIELPHVNVFTKIDLLRNHASALDFRLDFYAETQDLSRLIAATEAEWETNPKFAALNAAVCELVEDFNLVAFRPLDIQDKESVLSVLKEIDNANGFSLGSLKADLGFFNIAVSAGDDLGDRWGTLHERYIDKEDSGDDDRDEVT